MERCCEVEEGNKEDVEVAPDVKCGGNNKGETMVVLVLEAPSIGELGVTVVLEDEDEVMGKLGTAGVVKLTLPSDVDLM